jgi:hypothetical protein
LYAGVAELADAIDLGSIGNTVQVQVLSPAPYLCNEIDIVPEKLAFASFFCVLRVKISGVKPWMLFASFHQKGSRTQHNKKYRTYG